MSESTKSSTITLRDGRNLGYARYGDLNGAAVICLHGSPGSRIDFERFSSIARSMSAQLIAVDRPGIGLSSFHPGSTVLSHAKDIESLADHLKLDRYAVLGGSAGGPYALACAHHLPADRLKAVALVAGLGKPDMTFEGTQWSKWSAYKYMRYVPTSALRYFLSLDPGSQVHLGPEKHFELLKSVSAQSKPHEREVGLFDNEASTKLWQKTSQEAYKNGVEGPLQDTLRLGSDWGFKIGEIRSTLPVYLWYGNFDTMAPVSHGKAYAARIGQNTVLNVVDETHGSIFPNQIHAYLGQLVRCIREDADVGK